MKLPFFGQATGIIISNSFGVVKPRKRMEGIHGREGGTSRSVE